MLTQFLGRFSRYDHGKEINLEIYGVHPPPEYELSKVTFPVAAYWGDNDWLAGPEVRYKLLNSF